MQYPIFISSLFILMIAFVTQVISYIIYLLVPLNRALRIILAIQGLLRAGALSATFVMCLMLPPFYLIRVPIIISSAIGIIESIVISVISINPTQFQSLFPFQPIS
jgi:hypothetical protein